MRRHKMILIIYACAPYRKKRNRTGYGPGNNRAVFKLLADQIKIKPPETWEGDNPDDLPLDWINGRIVCARGCAHGVRSAPRSQSAVWAPCWQMDFSLS